MATAVQKDYYEVLGVSPEASADEIRKAYLKLAHKFHPDKTGGNKAAEDKLKEINEAYDTLKNPKKRKQYDAERAYGQSAFAGGGSQGGGFQGGGFTGGGFQGFDFGGSDEAGASFDEIFGSFFGGRGAAHARPKARPGNDLEVSVPVTLREVATGCRKTLRVPRTESCNTCGGTGAAPGASPKTCPACGGSGMAGGRQGFFSMAQTCAQCRGTGRVVENPCRACGGTGHTRRQREVTVTIPAGIDSGMRLRLAGEGEPGEHGGPRGDLYVLVKVQPDPVFKRDGSNIECEVPVSFTQAALGSKIRVPTLTGAAELKIPAGTQSGAALRMRGQGLPDPKTGKKGDQLVRIEVETPKKLSEEQKRLLRQLEELTSPGDYPRMRQFQQRMNK